jgi:hypothetical protein
LGEVEDAFQNIVRIVGWTQLQDEVMQREEEEREMGLRKAAQRQRITQRQEQEETDRRQRATQRQEREEAEARKMMREEEKRRREEERQHGWMTKLRKLMG